MNALTDQLRLAMAAVQYFTRIPVPAWVGHSHLRLNEAARYLPLVGMLVGAVAGGIFLLASAVLPSSLAILLSMAASIAVTGAFHEDGLADTCDGFGGGADKSAILAIMKDSRVGSFGVVGLVLALAIKYAALSALATGAFFAALVAAHAFSRFLALAVMYTHTYAREDSTTRAGAVAHNLSVRTLLIGAITGVAPLALLGAGGALAAGCALAVCLLLARYFQRRIGGYTGDCLGAIQQASEITFYITLVAWSAR